MSLQSTGSPTLAGTRPGLPTTPQGQLDLMREITGRSFRTVPVHGKRSLLPWAKATEELAHHPGATGYAILVGDGVVVVDTDTPEAEAWAESALPATLTVSTARGAHRYYKITFRTKNSSQHSRNALHKGIDVRGDGGYVIGPGSRHPSGTTYVISQALPLAPLPEAFHNLVKAPEVELPRARNARGVVTPPVFSNARRSGNRTSVFGDDPRVKPRTRELLRDTSDGRDFRLARVLLSLMRSGLTDEECVLQVSRSALGSKVREMEEAASAGYLEAKIRFTRDHVTRNPSERFTPGRWRQRAAGTPMPTGRRKVVDAIAMIATQANATKLTLSSLRVGEMASMTRQAALKNINRLVMEGWLKINTKTNVQARGLARSYTLTVPASSDSSQKLAVVDTGSDSWRHGCKGHWYSLYCALEAEEGTVAQLAQRIGKSAPTVRRQLTEMQERGMTSKTGKVWSLTPDAEIIVQTLAVGTKAEGARTRQKQHHAELRAERAETLRLLLEGKKDTTVDRGHGAGQPLTDREIEEAMAEFEVDWAAYAAALTRYRDLRERLALAV